MSAADRRKQLLFLCTGNSCRSQMAEAIVNARFHEQWRAFSAGSHPAGYVHPMAIKALAEIGINHAGSSKPVSAFTNQRFDLIVTVCDSAAESCPNWPGFGKPVHLSFPDPARATGTVQEIANAFRTVRDDLAARIEALLGEYVLDPVVPGSSGKSEP